MGVLALVVGVLLVAAVAFGALIGRGSPAPTPAPTPGEDEAAVALEHRDCVAYEPEELWIEEGSDGWILRAEDAALTGHRTIEDAELMMAVARRHTFQCFIGRDSDREDRHAYVLEYWLGNSGLISNAEDQHCIPFERDELSIVDVGEEGWALHAGEARLHVLDNRDHADSALALARIYQRFCVIGADTDLPHEYWG